MKQASTDYKAFEASSIKNKRLLRQEEFILEVAIAICEAMEREGVTKAELARRLGKTKGFVSQILAGGRNLTLRTVADVTDALGHKINIQVLPTEKVRESESVVRFEKYKAENVSWPLEQLRENIFGFKVPSGPVFPKADDMSVAA